MNKLLRKHRKWPISPYKAKWQRSFDQTLALQTLKQHQNPKTLLSALVDSFHSHGCDPTPEAYRFVVETLIGASQFAAVDPVLDRLESAEKFETPESLLARIIRFYGLSGRFGDAVDVFCRIPMFRCVPSCFSLNSLLYVLCSRNEGLRFVPDVLGKSKSMNIRLEESSFRILISALCRIGRVSYAIEIMNCMIEDGYDFDKKVCSLILSSICERRNEMGFDGLGVLGFLEGMKKLGFCPNVVDYSKVINVLVKERKGLEALKVLGKIKNDGIKPDIVCYTMVLDGIVSEGEFKKADKVFDELLVLGLVPDIHTYNAYINGFCEQNDVERGLEMLSSMEELGCKPNSITYNLIVKALCKNGGVDRAKELVSEMGSKGVEANFRTHRILLEGIFGRGEIFEACAFMGEMLEKGFCRRSSSYDEVVFGLCQRGMVSKGLDMLERMVGQNVGPGARAWESVLLSFGSELSFPKDIWTSLVNPEETSPEKDNGLKTYVAEEK